MWKSPKVKKNRVDDEVLIPNINSDSTQTVVEINLLFC